MTATWPVLVHRTPPRLCPSSQGSQRYPREHWNSVRLSQKRPGMQNKVTVSWAHEPCFQATPRLCLPDSAGVANELARDTYFIVLRGASLLSSKLPNECSDGNSQTTATCDSHVTCFKEYDWLMTSLRLAYLQGLVLARLGHSQTLKRILTFLLVPNQSAHRRETAGGRREEGGEGEKEKK